MKRNVTLFAVTFFLLATHSYAQELASPERVMQKVADKLAAVKLLGYKYRFDYSYPSQDRSMVIEAESFLDLKPVDGTSKFRFQFIGADRFSVYNGAERFTVDKTGKKLYVENKPSFDSFGDTLLMNSPLALKYALPRLIADRSIKKKVSRIRPGNREQYLIEFSLVKRVINAAGDIVAIRPDLTNKYQVKFDSATLLPVEVVEGNDKNDEVVKTTYAEITDKPAVPADLSWYFSTYQNEYTVQNSDRLVLIGSGKAAPGFSLDSFRSGSKVSLDQHKGKVVLLEFWIAHCGFCIAAVPKLNDLGQRFSEKGVEIVSINMYDPVATIEAFKKKNKPVYTILTGGESIAESYGVGSYPAFVLIDRSGRVVYSSSGLFEKELEAAITANLQE